MCPITADADGWVPLSGIRVLDLTSMLAGPYATRLLADLGAETIKIESVGRYDLTRGPLWRDASARVYPGGDPGPRPFNRSSYFNELNRNKLGMSLDLKTEEGKAIFLRLVEVSDLVIENFSAGTLSRLGLDYTTLATHQPAIVMVSMPSFGSDGPWARNVAYGSTIEMLSGMGALNGYPDGLPMTSGITYGDPVAGIHAATMAIAAVSDARQTGEGTYVDLSQLECLVTFLGEHIVATSLGGPQPARVGNQEPFSSPSGVYRCAGADAWVAIEVQTDAQWRALLEALHAPSSEFLGADYRERASRAVEIDAFVESLTASQSAASIMATLQAAGVPAGAVLTPGDVTTDANVVALGYLESISHSDAGDHPIPGAPWRAGQVAPTVKTAAPTFGEHTSQVLTDTLGLSEEQIATLRERGIIGPLSPDGEV